jgi:putative membrane protein
MPYMFDGGWMILWVVFGIAFWGGLILLGVWAVRRFTERPRRSGALDILEERFARGEIDAEEFERRRRALGERA